LFPTPPGPNPELPASPLPLNRYTDDLLQETDQKPGVYSPSTIAETCESETRSSPSFEDFDPDMNFPIEFGSNPLSLKSSFRSDRSQLWSYDDSALTQELRKSQDLTSSFSLASPLRRSFAFGGLKESFDAFFLRSSIDFKSNLSDSFTFDPPPSSELLSFFEEPFSHSRNFRQSFSDFDELQARQLS
jgi:hypothetical protein